MCSNGEFLRVLFQKHFRRAGGWSNGLQPSYFLPLCAFLHSYLCGPSEKDEFCRGQTPTVSVPSGPTSYWPGDRCHAARLGLSTTCGHKRPQTPGCLPRVITEEPLNQQKETPPRQQPARCHRQCDHLLQPGHAVTRELWSWQEKSAVRMIHQTSLGIQMKGDISLFAEYLVCVEKCCMLYPFVPDTFTVVQNDRYVPSLAWTWTL